MENSNEIRLHDQLTGASEPTKTLKRRARKARPTFTVGFRLDGYYLTLLEKGAATFGISVHEYARQRLLELLDRQEEAHLLAEMSEVRGGVVELREDIARTLEVILVNVTKGDSSKIRAWVDSNLRRG